MPTHLTRRPRILRGPYLEAPADAPVLTTPRLLLRPHRMADHPTWHRLVNSPEVCTFLDWPERDERESRAHLAARTRHTRLWQTDDFLALAVERTGQLIGDVSLQLRGVRPESRSVEIGWITDPRHAGRRYATEAASALLAFAFDEIGARWAIAAIDIENEPSVRVARRLGFTRAGGGAGKCTYLVTADDFAGRRGSLPLTGAVPVIAETTDPEVGPGASQRAPLG